MREAGSGMLRSVYIERLLNKEATPSCPALPLAEGQCQRASHGNPLTELQTPREKGAERKCLEHPLLAYLELTP